jgi:hypothetical protein
MSEEEFVPNLSILPPAQRSLWPELDGTPEHFTLYGGTAIALRLGHRTSVDFDLFSARSFDPDRLAQIIPYVSSSERVQVAANTLTCRVARGGPVLVSFFGGIAQGRAAERTRAKGSRVFVASLLDLAATKASVVQKRAEAKDYVDIDALIQHGIDLPTILSAACAVFGSSFNPMITVKALGFFGDVPNVPQSVRSRISDAVARVDVTKLPPFEAIEGSLDGK